MSKPVVVIVGRPNVGKSTFFNRVVGFRKAIVEDVPGITRDRNYMDAEWDGKAFTIVDTGGFYPEPPEDIFEQVREQALFAVSEASVIIHLMDGKDGLMPTDIEISRILRASGKKVISAVNKIDGPKHEPRLYEFYSLGADELLAVSAETGYDFGELMDRVAAFLPAAEKEAGDYPKAAVIGRPNVGKSTLINTLLGKKRLIVSAEAGTTRDSIDTLCSFHKKKYLFIDTAGIRRKGYPMNRFSIVRTLKTIERCDVALIVLDASEGIVSEDQKIAGMVLSYGKGAVLLLNKWDLVKDPENDYKRLTGEVARKLWFLSHAPILTTSGLESKRLTKVFPLIDSVINERKKTIPRPELKRFLEDALKSASIPSYRGRKVKIYYMAQVATEPPQFKMLSDHPEALNEPFLKYLENRLRERYSFSGTPIRIMKRGGR